VAGSPSTAIAGRCSGGMPWARRTGSRDDEPPSSVAVVWLAGSSWRNTASRSSASSSRVTSAPGRRLGHPEHVLRAAPVGRAVAVRVGDQHERAGGSAAMPSLRGRPSRGRPRRRTTAPPRPRRRRRRRCPDTTTTSVDARTIGCGSVTGRARREAAGSRPAGVADPLLVDHLEHRHVRLRLAVGTGAPSPGGCESNSRRRSRAAACGSDRTRCRC
jgi:hypothetical protein